MATATAPLLAFVIIVATQQAAMSRVPPLAALKTLDFRLASQQASKECGDVACLHGAANACTPAHLGEDFSTIEGADVRHDTFVIRDGSKCVVVAFFDHTADYWGGCLLLKRTCSTLEGVRGDFSHTEGCSEVALQKLEPCNPPF